MVLGKDNQVEQRTIVAERAIGDHWLVTNGLNAGDQLIVEGLNKIHAGDTVRPVAVNSPTVGSDTRAASTAQPTTVRAAAGKPATSR
jgi:membrane fusion protein (multidrug efflux system)